MLPGSNLSCTTPADVYLLLKSSDFVMNDVEQARELRISSSTTSTTTTASDLPASSSSLASASSPTPPSRPQLTLVLKKWFDMPPSAEFRCFVRAGRFVAVSQRDTTFYEHLQDRERVRDIRQKLAEFWVSHLKRRPAEAAQSASDAAAAGVAGPSSSTVASGTTGFPLDDYAFDAYLTRDGGRVFLIDINPYLPRTDNLLWDWDELDALARGEKVTSRPVNGVSAGDQLEEDEETDTDDDEEEEEDDGFETVLRVYTDGSGRQPQAIRVPLSEQARAADAARRAASRSRERDQPPSLRRRLGGPLPLLRVITSHLHSEQAACNTSSGMKASTGPKYATNMIPRDVLDASANGESIAEFAREWHKRLSKAME